MYRQFGRYIYGTYGFLDAFNPSFTSADEPLSHGRFVPGFGWVDEDYLGIDQGALVAMIENYRSGLIWSVMRGNAVRAPRAYARRFLGRLARGSREVTLRRRCGVIAARVFVVCAAVLMVACSDRASDVTTSSASGRWVAKAKWSPHFCPNSSVRIPAFTSKSSSCRGRLRTKSC